ncbi:MAG: lipoprotein [Sinobacteraceae bacterium]|nr:lipoprotein [Nevskiaceae bacterium]
MNLRLLCPLCLSLAACGQTGDLYLPQKQPPPTAAQPQKKDAQQKEPPAAAAASVPPQGR